MSDNNFVKVFFVQKISEEEFEIESLWCEKFGNRFLIDNIPFVAKNVSSGDIIKVTFDESPAFLILLIAFFWIDSFISTVIT